MDLNYKDSKGRTALDLAASSGDSYLVQYLLEQGAKLGPSTWAMASGKPYIILTLLNKLLEDGNTLYKKNKLAEASQRYQYAAKRVPSTNQGDHNKKVFDQLRIHLLLNLSSIFLL